MDGENIHLYSVIDLMLQNPGCPVDSSGGFPNPPCPGQASNELNQNL